MLNTLVSDATVSFFVYTDQLGLTETDRKTHMLLKKAAKSRREKELGRLLNKAYPYSRREIDPLSDDLEEDLHLIVSYILTTPDGGEIRYSYDIAPPNYIFKKFYLDIDTPSGQAILLKKHIKEHSVLPAELDVLISKLTRIDEVYTNPLGKEHLTRKEKPRPGTIEHMKRRRASYVVYPPCQ